MSSVPLIIWGAKGHAKVLEEFLQPAGYRLVAVFDNDPNAVSPFHGVPLYIGQAGLLTWLEAPDARGAAFCVAIGGARGRDRVAIHEQLASAGCDPIRAIHPKSFVARNATLGDGSQVLAGACVCAEVRMGRCCIVNTRASVDHESLLGDGVHVAPGATVTGCVQLGDHSFVGAGAVILPGLRVGANAVVGAGSIVTRDVPEGALVVGHPARVRRFNT